jgi:hypothetical protein
MAPVIRNTVILVTNESLLNSLTWCVLRGHILLVYLIRVRIPHLLEFVFLQTYRFERCLFDALACSESVYIYLPQSSPTTLRNLSAKRERRSLNDVYTFRVHRGASSQQKPCQTLRWCYQSCYCPFTTDYWLPLGVLVLCPGTCLLIEDKNPCAPKP